METSILTSTKKVLGIEEDNTDFDLDVITLVNSAFSTLTQLGVGPSEGFMIEDASADWSEFEVSVPQESLVKTHVLLKVKNLFDPPTTGYLVEETRKQIEEIEWRLNTFAEEVEV